MARQLRRRGGQPPRRPPRRRHCTRPSRWLRVAAPAGVAAAATRGVVGLVHLGGRPWGAPADCAAATVTLSYVTITFFYVIGTGVGAPGRRIAWRTLLS